MNEIDELEPLRVLDNHKPTHSGYTGGWWELACTGCDFAKGRRLSHLDWAPHNAHREEVFRDAILAAGYRKVFDGDCGLSNVKDPDDREAAEAWMRWANLAMNDEIGAIGAMKQMLTELGYRKQAQS